MQEKVYFQVIYWILFNFFILFTFAMVDIVVIYSTFWSIIFSIKRKLYVLNWRMKTRIGNKKCIAPKKKKSHTYSEQWTSERLFVQWILFFRLKTNKQKIKRKKFYSDFNRNVFKWFFCGSIQSTFDSIENWWKFRKSFEWNIHRLYTVLYSLWKSMGDTSVKYIGVYFKLKRIWCFFLGLSSGPQN